MAMYGDWGGLEARGRFHSTVVLELGVLYLVDGTGTLYRSYVHTRYASWYTAFNTTCIAGRRGTLSCSGFLIGGKANGRREAGYTW